MRPLALGLALVVIVAAIIYLEAQKPTLIAPGSADIPVATTAAVTPLPVASDSVIAATPTAVTPAAASLKTVTTAAKPTPAPIAAVNPAARSAAIASKSGQYERAKELVNPSGFINTEPFKIADLIGKNVILVDFWTYSCINCQRTLPYLTAWDAKYHKAGLTIVGVHTPEFEFEHERSNVAAAVKKFGIRYAVVQDNNYATWQAYGNRFWPHKYLIDIDGFIVYDHIGEGGYDLTEQKIQALLRERAAAFGQSITIPAGLVQPGVTGPSAELGSPEIYFGASRNEYLGNGEQGQTGTQTLELPAEAKLNTLYLGGRWRFSDEFAENQSAGQVVFRYRAKKVYVVASAAQPIKILINRDGRTLKTITVQADQLYPLINESGVEEHTLELIINQPGLRFYTFTFG